MIPIDSVTTFIFASLLLSLSPGPDNLFVMTQSVLYGKKTGILITLGLCTGLIGHTAVVAFGLAAIIQTSEVAYTLLKILGASYLFYLAWQAMTEHSSNIKSNQQKQLTDYQLYRRGIIMNLTNPKISLFFKYFPIPE